MKELFRSRTGISWPRAAAAAVLSPALATAIAFPLSRTGPVSAASLYLLAVVAAAALGGIRAGFAAAALSFLGLNFLFTPPRYTFRVEDPADVVALLVFLMVAVVVGGLLAWALDQQARAARREHETRLLSYTANRLLSGAPLERVLSDFAEALRQSLGLQRCEIHAAGEAGEISVSAGRSDGDGPSTRLALTGSNEPLGTLTAVRPAGSKPLGQGDLRLLEASAKQAAAVLERARLERLARGARLESETNKMRAALFSSVTHDLRTPLASIKASVTSLLDDEARHDPGQREELLRTVLEETDRLNRLVGNLIDLARVRAGALVPNKEPTALDEVVEAVLARMRATLSPFRVRTIFRSDLPDVAGDPVQMDQVLTNLLENAARYSPPAGQIQVSVQPWRRMVRVRVVDQGPGIPPEERERVFEAFYRRDAGGGRGGSGLGLAIARAIVQAHGGSIWIEGAPAGGTAVVFDLPVFGDGRDVAAEASSTDQGRQEGSPS